MRRLSSALMLLAGLLVGACGTRSGSSDMGRLTTPSVDTDPVPTTLASEPTGEPNTRPPASVKVNERFGAAINELTVEPHLGGADLLAWLAAGNEAVWLADVAHFFVVGKLVSVEPGPIRDGYWKKLTCEASEGVPIPGDCSHLVQYRGVVLTIETSERRTLPAGQDQPPLPALVEVEFPGAPYSAVGTIREDADRRITEVVDSAPIGAVFALFTGVNNWGLQQGAGSWSWGWVDGGTIRAIPGATEAAWTSGSERVASILSLVDSKGATR